MSDVEIVARGLTKAQREVLISHQPGQQYGEDIWPFRHSKHPLAFKTTARPMMDTGLLRWCDDKRTTATVLTFFGLAVRQYLLENADDR